MVSRLLGLFGRGAKDLECDDIQELGSDYIDEELNSKVAEKVRGHISWCGPCNAFMSTLRATVDILRASPKKDAPAGFKDRVRQSLHDHD